MIKCKAGKIPPSNLFFILFISRIVVTMAYVQAISVGMMCSDILISLVTSFLTIILLSLPAYYAVKTNKNPTDNKVISIFYGIYFMYVVAVNVSRFSYFASTRLNPNSTTFIFIVLILIAVCYASCLGIESLGRFSMFCGIIIILTMISVIIFNIKNANEINFYPIIQNKSKDIILNSVLFTSNSIEPAVMLALSKKVNGKIGKAYFGSIAAAYFTVFCILLMCVLVMGNSLPLQAFPVFTLFQLASIKSFSRLDIIHTAFWILAVFLKCSVLIYCTSIMTQKFNHRKKCVVLSVVSLGASVFATEFVIRVMSNVTKPITIATFVIFCVVIPVCTLIFTKKNKREKIIEKF